MGKNIISSPLIFSPVDKFLELIFENVIKYEQEGGSIFENLKHRVYIFEYVLKYMKIDNAIRNLFVEYEMAFGALDFEKRARFSPRFRYGRSQRSGFPKQGEF